MNILASLAALLLSLVGYSLGTVSRFGKKKSRKPIVLDIFVVLVMWVAVIVTRIKLPFNRWLMLAGWIAAGAVLGFVMSLILGFSKAESQAGRETAAASGSSRKRFQAWRDLSAKLGTFQSQILLGLLFLIVFAPVALGVKFFSDPLHLKKPGTGSHWFPKAPITSSIELFKRQS